MSITYILDKNVTFTNFHQVYHYINKKSIQLASKHLTISHKYQKFKW